MTCSSAHEQTPLSSDAIDSILRHREVGCAKDLSAPPRIMENFDYSSHYTNWTWNPIPLENNSGILPPETVCSVT